jgi:fucose permease
MLFFCDAGLELTLGQWSFTLLTERHGLGVAAAGLGTSLYWASMTVGRFAIGLVVHRIGPDRLVRLVMAGAFAGAVLVALGSAPLCVAGLMLAGLSLAPIFPTLIARVPARIGARLALDAVGFNVSLAMVGTAALPGLAGVLAGRLGLAAIGWLAVGVAALLLILHELLLARAPRHVRSPALESSRRL